ncbi:hypothetical protein [uncultured Modestobacter sp.]|uniref:hypothetical protein n=1 Tax=uncultured Modestobacter sp. TaxID=380048 RepID=UPI00260EAA32|nr:hypothetical protein [uncultured Modestobacter sp.]
MPGRRSVVDHALQRRARLADVCRGHHLMSDALGAEPASGRAPRTTRRAATE